MKNHFPSYALLFAVLATTVMLHPEAQTGAAAAPKSMASRQNSVSPQKHQAKPASGSCTIGETVHPEVAAQLAKFQRVRMPFSGAGLAPRERQMLEKLVDASRDLESIYWRQSDPEGLELLRKLERCNRAEDRPLRRYLMINGSRFDLLDENRPFVGNEPLPPGRALYPRDLTRAQIEDYVARHPEKKAEIYSPFTVVKRQGDELVGVPYHVEFRQWLEPAAKALRQAADLSPDKAFAGFLRLRAEALLTDDFYKSDLAWLDLEDPRFDVIFAPYETYLDDLLGVKTSYGAAVMVRNQKESAKLVTYKKYVPDIQESLPVAPEDKPSKKGHSTPMEVMDTPFRVGDLRHGYQVVADNLPNDARIHQEKGTKKIFFKDFMDARVNYVVLPIGKRLMRADQAAMASMDGYLAAVLMHEICHGLGPDFAHTSQGQIDIREAIGPAFSGLEEAKADVVGLFGLNWLIGKGVLPREREREYYASFVAGIFRTVRFGVAEAHSRAEMMEFNFLAERGAITRDAGSGRYVIDFERMPGAIAALAKELLEMEATGDRNRTEQWFKKYGSMPSELKSQLQAIHDVPVDFDPVSSFREKPQ
jgi:hypothetical protein